MAYAAMSGHQRRGVTTTPIIPLIVSMAVGVMLSCSSPPAGDPIVIAAVGDIMMGSDWPDPKDLPPDDGAGLFADVAPILSRADVAFGNLEGPLLDGGRRMKCEIPSPTCRAFRTPSRYASHLKNAGFDVMSLANNHALDFGLFGRTQTQRALDKVGIAHSGAKRDIARLTAKGRTLRVIAFATYDGSYNLHDLEEATGLVSDLSSNGHLVIVSVHGGGEGRKYQHVPVGPEMYLDENRGDLRLFARAVIDAGADLVLGHGPHVVRAMEIYRNRLIAYSLGNFVTYGPFYFGDRVGVSLVLEAHLATDGVFLGGVIHPIRQIEPGGPRLDPERQVVSIVQELSDADFPQTAVVVRDDGSVAAPRRLWAFR